jgi:hypothetical protein
MEGMGRLLEPIKTPIQLGPSEVVEGQIEFEVHDEIHKKFYNEGLGLHWIKFHEGHVWLKEHRSGRSIELRMGEGYDAVTGKVIPKPRPSRSAVLKLAIRRWKARIIAPPT